MMSAGLDREVKCNTTAGQALREKMKREVAEAQKKEEERLKMEEDLRLLKA